MTAVVQTRLALPNASTAVVPGRTLYQCKQTVHLFIGFGMLIEHSTQWGYGTPMDLVFALAAVPGPQHELQFAS